MYCVKDVNVNDVITFDHSAEIEVQFLTSLYALSDVISFHFCSISGQVKDARAAQTIARRFSEDRQMQEVLLSVEPVS